MMLPTRAPNSTPGQITRSAVMLLFHIGSPWRASRYRLVLH
jgi:hypothetical protein